MFKRILLAYDGSDNAFRAVEKIAYIAEKMEGSSITVVYVVDGTTSKEDVLHYSTKEQIDEKRKQRLNRVGEYFGKMGITYQYEILYGEAPKKIVEFANSHDFDLVVVGSRGLNGLQEMVLGSVSHKVAKRVKAPVMIIK